MDMIVVRKSHNAQKANIYVACHELEKQRLLAKEQLIFNAFKHLYYGIAGISQLIDSLEKHYQGLTNPNTKCKVLHATIRYLDYYDYYTANHYAHDLECAFESDSKYARLKNSVNRTLTVLAVTLSMAAITAASIGVAVASFTVNPLIAIAVIPIAIAIVGLGIAFFKSPSLRAGEVAFFKPSPEIIIARQLRGELTGKKPIATNIDPQVQM
jgi:hypothetical protein